MTISMGSLSDRFCLAPLEQGRPKMHTHEGLDELSFPKGEPVNLAEQGVRLFNLCQTVNLSIRRSDGITSLLNMGVMVAG